LKKEKVHIPRNKTLRPEVIQLHHIELHHNVLVAGLGEKWKMIELVTRNYWWLGMIKDVRRYIKGCNLY